MKYWPRFIADYRDATRDLSMLEDGCYSRMLDLYYQTEKPLPAVHQLVVQLNTRRTHTVERLLARYFTLEDDGCWHNKAADRYIAKFKARSPHREARKALQQTRSQRHRQARTALVQALAAEDCVMPEGTSMKLLRDAAAKLGIVTQMNGQDYQGSLRRKPVKATDKNASRDASRDADEASRNAALKEENLKPKERDASRKLDDSRDATVGDAALLPARAAEIAKDGGIVDAFASDAKLAQLCARGATERDFEIACVQAAAGKKGWDWVLYRVEYRIGMREHTSGQ